MISEQLIYNLVKRAGFTDSFFHFHNKQLTSLFELVIDWERQQCADLCNLHGQIASYTHGDFAEGKMDAFFKAAEYILQRSQHEQELS